MHHMQTQKTRRVVQNLGRQPMPPIDRSRHEVRASDRVLCCDGKQDAIEQYDATIHERLNGPIRRLCNGTIIEQYIPQNHINALEALVLDLTGLLTTIPDPDYYDTAWEARKQKAMQLVAELIPEGSES